MVIPWQKRGKFCVIWCVAVAKSSSATNYAFLVLEQSKLLLEFIYLQMPLHLLYPQDFGFLYFISTQRSSNPFFPADIVNEPFDIGGEPK